MTKKHYEAIAEIIEIQLSKCDNEEQISGILRLTNGLVEYFQQENPRFDCERFYAACSITQ